MGQFSSKTPNKGRKNVPSDTLGRSAHNKITKLQNTIMREIYYNVEYASQALTEIPLGYVDKTVPGCGLTTVALENQLDTIIAVPNVELIDNKLTQYPSGRCSYSLLGVKSGVSNEEIRSYVAMVLGRCHPIKIMVTFDSLARISWILKKYKSCRLIIDESQELLRYSRLKAKSKSSAYSFEAVSSVFNIAQTFIARLSFVSATPIKLKYLPDWVSNLEQVKMKWANTIAISPVSMERSYPKRALIHEILNPIEKNGSVIIGGLTLSKAIIFVKSLSTIKYIVDNSLVPKEDIRVIMGNNKENNRYMSGFKRLDDYANLPKYTFVTGTGFKGIDLYDDSAVNIVVSEIKKDFTMIDLSTDLKQAISRQRKKSNPHYGKFLFIYNQSSFTLSEIELLAKTDEVKDKVSRGVEFHFSTKVGKEDKLIFDDFIGNDKDFIEYTLYDESAGLFRFNDNLYNSDVEFILETRRLYEKGVNIIAELQGNWDIQEETIIEAPSYEHIQEYYRANGNFGEYEVHTEFVETITTCEKYFGKTFSNHTYAKKKIIEYQSFMTPQLVLKVQDQFETNEKYTSTVIKETLQRAYDNNGVGKIAKTTDIKLFMNVETFKSGNKRGYKIIDKSNVAV